MKFKLLLISIILFLFCFSLASSFSIQTDDSSGVYLCARETGIFKDKVIGTDSEVIDIDFYGAAEEWATVAPETISLNEGDTKEVYTYITPDNGAEPGIYDLLLSFKKADGTSKTINHKVYVKKCHDVEILANVVYGEICPSKDIKYSFTVVNNGEKIEGYSLSSQGLDSVKLSDKKIVLNPGESKIIYAYVKAPAEAGEFPFEVIVEGDSGKAKDYIAALLKVNSCFAFDIEVDGGGYLDICDHSLNLVPLTIKNLGTTSNRYDVTVDGPSWVDTTRHVITTNSDYYKKFHVMFKPDYGVEGNFSARINILPSKGETKSYVDFGINVRKCHDVDVVVEKEYLEVCIGNPSQTNEVVVTNVGEYSKTYNLDVTDYSWINSNFSNFSLDPGVSKKFIVNIDPDESVSGGIYSVDLNAYTLDDSDVEKQTSFEVGILDLETCYSGDVEFSLEDVKLYKESETMITLNLENEGVYSDNYKLSLSGNALDFVNLNPTEVKLEAGESQELYLYVAPKESTEIGFYGLGVSVVSDKGFVFNKDLSIEITNNASDVGVSGGSWWVDVKDWFGNIFSSDNETIEEINVVEEESSWEKYKYYLLGVVIVILIILVFIRLGIFKKISNSLIEEEKEDIKKGIDKKKK